MEPYSFKQNNAEFLSIDCKCKVVTKFVLTRGFYDVYTSCVPYDINPSAPECFHKTTIYILDQHDSENLRHISRVDEPTFTRSYITNNVTILSNKITKNHIKNDSIIIKFMIEPFFSNCEYRTCSQNGTLTWKIDNYSKRKQDQIDGVTWGIYSDYFLSGKRGYRMKIKCYYDDRSNVICIHLRFVHGEFDHLLKNKFLHKTTFTIIDQSDKQKKTHLRKTVDSVETKFDEVKFTCKELENSTYLKNDCMIVKVRVVSI